MDDTISNRANYGIDAPSLVAAFSIGGIILVLSGILAHFFFSNIDSSLVSSIVIIGVIVGCIMFAGAIVMLWSSRYGKLIACRYLISYLHIKDHETIVDVGCGRGLLLIEAAKRITSGKVIGIDLWKKRDLSGNTKDAVLANAKAENVTDRVEVKTGDMRSLPIEDKCVDVVISSLAIHNIPTQEGRAKAIEEISRVLKPGGRIALMDLAHSKEHIKTLKHLGWSYIERSKLIFYICPPVRIVFGAKSNENADESSNF